jgi:PhnB protein
MATVNVYLTFNGNCEEAFEFYKTSFGKEISYLGRFKDMPPQDGVEMDAEAGGKIMHVCLPISKETMLMGSDTGGEWAAHHKVGNNMSVSIHAGSKEETDRLFGALSNGGRVTMPLADTFWGDYFGMFEDRFGINWMIAFPLNQH